MLTAEAEKGRLLVIRADADSRMGTGHVMRCLALARAWQERGGRVVLAGHIGSDSLRQRLSGQGIELMGLVSGPPAAEEMQWLDTLRRQQAGRAEESWIVLDGYQFDQPYQQRLRRSGLKLLVIDDYAHLPAYDADLLLNQNPGGEKLDYQTPPETVLLRGGKYVLLRREFLEARRREIADSPEQAARLLITLGGADPDNATLKVMEALQRLELPAVQAKIIVGPANSHLPLLREWMRGGSLSAELLVDVHDMAPLMQWADAAVTAGGSTCWELACLGVPALVITLADNQRGVARIMAESGAGLDCGWHHALQPDQLAGAIAALCRNRRQRQAMHAAGRALVDGEGADRVAERMLCFPFAFRPAEADDCRQIFAWANDPVIRSASFHRGAIGRQEHEAWFARTLADPDTLFWIIMLHGDRPAGQVRFAINNGEAVISISLAAEYRHAGLGSRAISTACCRLFARGGIDVVHARIRKDNAQSIKSFSRAGFVLHSEEAVQGVPALHMSLRDTR